MIEDDKIFQLERPHPNLLKVYLIHSILTLPGFFIIFPVLFFRYHTLRYKFDNEGVSVSWGILFRQQVNLTYSRIQDIHMHAGFIQRWFGIADLKIQTASGNASAEMTIEGFKEFADIRDFLYGKMRGLKDSSSRQEAARSSQREEMSDKSAELLREILGELRLARQSMEKLSGKKTETQTQG